MNYRRTKEFKNQIKKLSSVLQIIVKKQYLLLVSNSSHPSLQFKELRPGWWSIRITNNYRCLGIHRIATKKYAECILWYKILPHSKYDYEEKPKNFVQ